MMLTVTMDISEKDSKKIITLAQDVMRSPNILRLTPAFSFLEWILNKKKRGLKVERKDPSSWHITVPE